MLDLERDLALVKNVPHALPPCFIELHSPGGCDYLSVGKVKDLLELNHSITDCRSYFVTAL